jgi:hypothetical protein
LLINARWLGLFRLVSMQLWQGKAAGRWGEDTHDARPRGQKNATTWLHNKPGKSCIGGIPSRDKRKKMNCERWFGRTKCSL